MEDLLIENMDLRSLLRAIALLRNGDEAAHFFRDLCTASELEAMAERWRVVQLIEKQIPYREISRQTGASTATVTRVAHWLKRGEGGYRMMLKRLRSCENESKKKD